MNNLTVSERGITSCVDSCVITSLLWLGLSPGPISSWTTPQLFYFLKKICSSTLNLKEEKVNCHPFNGASRSAKAVYNTCWGRHPTEGITSLEEIIRPKKPNHTAPFCLHVKIKVFFFCQFTNISKSLQVLIMGKI